MLAADGNVPLPALHLAASGLQSVEPPWASELARAAPRNPGLDLSRAAIGEENGKPVFFGGLNEAEFRTREKRCLATAIYFEARGESVDGQIAVAQTILNRVRSAFYPDTICGVVYQGSQMRNACQFSFACDRTSDVPKEKPQWETANEIAERVLKGEAWLESVGHASHYHATYVQPDWIPEMRRLTRIGSHVFYRANFLDRTESVAGSAR
jgi:spore germination cell wall hydrolase CwlJ-like protein